MKVFIVNVVIVLGIIPMTAAVDAADWMPDANLRKAVKNSIGLTQEDTLTTEQMTNLVELKAAGCGITDITGLEYATNMTIVRLSRNQISNISMLSGLTSLEVLRLDGMDLTSLTSLINLSNVREIFVRNNQITDVRPITKLTNLQTLRISGNPLENAHLLSQLTGLTFIDITIPPAPNPDPQDPLLEVVVQQPQEPEFDLAQTQTSTPVSERTPLIRDAIVRAAPVDAAEDVTDQHLAAIEHLNFNPLALYSLKVGDFDGLTTLKKLNLAGNSAPSYPANIFDDLIAVTELNLAGGRFEFNPLAVFPADLFENCTNLLYLNISSNYIGTLPAGLFDNQTNLKTLSINRNNLTTLPANLFDNLTSLHALELNGNRFDSLPVDTFDSLSNLALLSLRACYMPSLPTGIFDNLTKLLSLDLSYNEFVTVDAALFQNLPNLGSLRLDNNQLSGLPEDMFTFLNEPLRYLELGANTIDPMPLYLNLYRFADDQFKVIMPTGAPFNIRLPLEVTNGSINGGIGAVTIRAGRVESRTITVTQTPGTNVDFTLEIGTLPSLPSSLYGRHRGYRLVIGENIVNSPVFAEGHNAYRSVIENTGPGTDIGTPVSVTNANSLSSLTYTLSGTDVASFDIVAATGQLQTKATLDYEMKRTYSVTVTASDGTNTDTINVTITVTDANDNSPMFSAETATRTIAENTNSGVNIGQRFTASDVDTVGTLRYSLSGTDATVFDIVAATGQLRTKTPLDYEGTKSYTVIVTASDGVNTDDTITVTINITDLNDTAPIFDDGASTTREVEENTSAGVNIGNPVSATDADTVGTLTYTLSGTDETHFDIDATDGQLKTKGALDYETKNTYTVTVTVSDGVNTDDTITVTINVTDANDNAPSFSEGADTTRSIAENTAADTDIGNAVSATDPDNDTLTYTLSGTDSGDFKIEGANGQLKTKSSLDRETKDTYSVIVTVSDGTNTDTINVTINVTDVNDNSPVFSSDTTTRSIAENTSANTNIGTVVSASDVDTVGTVTYSLSGTDSSDFKIVAATGQLQTKSALDRETKDSYTVTVTASDSVNTDDTITVTINITDVNDNSPTFDDGASTTREVAENTAADVNIGTAISASDVDTVGTLSYTLGGTDKDDFKIVATSGQLQTKNELDYETKNTYSVTVTVSDGVNTDDTIAVTINVTDVNDNAPSFTEGTDTTRSIAENTAADTNIGSPVAASDADTVTLTYTLGGTDADDFKIVDTSGQLQTKSALDYETKNSYTVTITASDGTDTDTINVTINITDVNDNSPVFSSDSTTRSIAENTAEDTNIGTVVSASDVDTVGKLSYSLSGTDATDFNIVAATGQLLTKNALDRETKDSYTVTVTASDSVNTDDTITVTISITDVNDNSPTFDDGASTTREVAENTGADVNIGTAISASDVDTVGTLAYTLGGTDANDFKIVDTSGQLQTKSELDYETKNSYSVTVTVSDGVNTDDTIAVTINVTDVNDNAPSFTEGTDTTRSIAENTAADTNIGSPVAASDADTVTLTYTLGGTDADDFKIVDTSGQLQTKNALDYETKNSYTVTVTASDGTDTDTINVTINITDVNDNAPAFSADTATRSIAENTAANANIGAVVTATDVDTVGTLSYSLSGTDASDFNIVAATGQLRTKNALDRETKDSYTVTVTASDSVNTDDTITVTINITDVNDNSPTFDDGASTTREVAENTAADENIGTAISASDVDTVGTLTYTLGGTDANDFKIVDTSGQLQTKNELDYETKSTYSVTVTVSDGVNTDDTITVTINVTDVNDNAPSFTEGTDTTRSIAENTAADTNIGSPVAANDADTDTLTYTLGGTDADDFKIVDTSGQLQTKNALDYETKNSYTVTITASDGTDTDTINVTINITDVNDNSPVFSSDTTTRSIAENTAEDTDIGTAVTATDVDTVGTVTYSLSGTDSSDFKIVAGTGQLQTKSDLDRETKDSYTVTVTASDGVNTDDTITVTISITDVNDNSPTFDDGASTTRSIAENTAADVNIGTAISASDVDTVGTLSYSLSGTDANDFKIVDTSGQLQTKNELDYETKNTYSVTVTVSDGVNTDDTIAVTINVTDVNDNAPSFTEGTDTTRSIAENTAADTNIGSPVAASDADTVTLTYTLGGTDADDFKIVDTSGQLQTKNALDYETKNSYTVTVTASDGTDTDTINVTINVTDVNDNSPVFSSDTTTRSIAENTAANSNIGTAVSATDADIVGTLAYSLSGTDADDFDIDSTDGQLKTKSDLDYEGTKSYTVTVTVSDGVNTDDTITVTINVTDVNDNAPTFDDGASTTREVEENTAADTNIGSAVSATDVDTVGTLSYTLGGINKDDFDIDTTDGQLKTKSSLDYEGTKSYTVTVTVSDGTNTDTITVTINVTDVNDNSPAFSSDTTSRSIAENTAADTNIGSAVSASDVDTVGTVTYTLSGTDSSDFNIVAATGQLQTKSALDRETKGEYSVIVTASDSVNTDDTITVTITITDVNDNSPVFSSDTTTRSIAENTAADSNIGSAVSATDADIVGTLVYSLGGTDADDFDIDSTDGQLKTKSTLDYEGTKKSYTVTVTVSDGVNTDDTITVTINVTDVNDNAPSFSEGADTTREVAENTAADTNIGTAISASDVDTVGTLTYTLGGTDANDFKIVDTSGQLQTKNELDYETKNIYSVTVTVSDGVNTDDTITVTINVTDVNDNSPAFSSDTTSRSIAENTAANADIGTAVTATDVDTVGTVTYSLSGTDSSDFNIVAASGQLQTKSALDRETKDEYSVIVTASDSVNTDDTITVTINITDLNDNAPIFDEGTSTTRSVDENTSSSENIGEPVSASDADIIGTLTYTLDNGTDASAFSINSSTGQLLTSGVLDFEEQESYTVTITVSDGNATDTITVTINITNLFDSVCDRTPQVRDAIVTAVQENHPEITDCKDVTDTHLADITRLDLTNTGITSLKVGDFSGLTHAAQLYLSNNSLTSLPEGVFTGWIGGWLRLDNNQLASIPENIFNEVNLRQIDLNHNALTTLPADLFDGKTLLSVINLGNNKLSTVPADLFDGLTGTVEINLNNNSLTSLPETLFDDVGYDGFLHHFMRVRLDSNGLTSIPADIFDGLARLSTVRLDNNALTTLPGDLFDGLGQLSVVRLDDNSLSSLPGNLFDEQQNLKAIDLRNNSLSTLPNGIFAGLTILEDLFLSGNTVDPLPLTVSLTLSDTRQFMATVPIGAPFSMELPISVTNGILYGETSPITVPIGGVESSILTLVRSPGTTEAVTADIGTLPAIPAEELDEDMVLTGGHNGYQLVKSNDLPLTVINAVDEDTTNTAPAFDEGETTTREVAENTVADTNIGTPVTATDADTDDTLVYILDGTDATKFNIDSATGQLKTKDSLDYETTDSYTVTVIVADDIYSDSITVTINITDVNDNPPVFSEGSDTMRTVEENIGTGSNIGEPVSATDPDTVGTLTYTTSGNDATVFNIVSTTGQLQTKDNLDYETKNVYKFTITVSDGIHTDTINVTINIVPFPLKGRTQQVQDAIILEVGSTNLDINDAMDVTFAHLAAITELILDNDSISSLLPGDFVGLTALKQLQLNRNELSSLPADIFDDNTALEVLNLNRNNLSSLPEDIFDGLTALKELYLNYSNLPTLPADIFDGLTALEELYLDHNSAMRSLPAGLFDGLTALELLYLNNSNVLASLPASIFDDLTALKELHLNNNALTSLPANIFDHNSALNLLYLNSNTLTSLNADIFDNLTTLTELKLNGNEMRSLPAGLFDELTALTLLHLNGNFLNALPADIFDHNTALTTIWLGANRLSTLPDRIFEGLTTLTTLKMQGNTIDPLPVTISLEKGEAGEFKMVAHAGAPFEIVVPVTITNGSLSGGATSVTIAAGSVESDTVTVIRTTGTTDAVTVDIGTLPDIPSEHGGYALVKPDTGLPLTVIAANAVPVFSDGDSTTREVSENTEANENIGTPIAATDADTDDTLTYTLDATSAATFSIDGATGQLQTKEALDRETTSSYTVTVTVSDGNGGSDTITVTINITDVNDNAPTFDDGDTTTRSIDENTEANQDIGEPIAATDADTDDTLTYTLDATGAMTFSIDSGSGQLKTKGSLDYETTTSYEVTVTVSDGENTDDTITVTINITDVNDNAPTFSADTATRSIDENTAANVNIGNPVTASDADTVGTLTYSLSGTDATDFNIIAGTGQLRTKNALDRETKDSYTVTVTASDSVNTDDTITVTINITDLNDNAPVFSEGASATREVAENTAAGEDIGNSISATDADTVGTLTYTLSGTDVDHFDIDSTNGQLKTKSSLDYETKNTYTVTVTVSDGVNTDDTIDVTINVTDANDNAPVFTEGDTTTRDVKETAATDEDIGEPIAATDVDTVGTLTYTLSGTDAETFDIDSSNGQLKTEDALDYGTTTSYTVTVSVSDGTASDTITVTINVIPYPLRGRTQAVQNAIVAAVPGVTAVSGVTETHLAAVTSLSVVGNRSLTSLLSGDFGGLTALRTLYLNGNALTSLPSGIFDGLTELRTLWLSGNALTSLSSGIFDKLTALEVLDLGSNALTSLSSGIFDKLTALKELELDHNSSLSSLPSGIFDENTALEKLSLSHSPLSSLPANIFDNLTALKELFLTNISLSSLDADTFDGLTALKILYLSRNSLSSLDADIFDETTALEKLYLNNNSLSALPDGLFDGISTLSTLELQGNTVHPLPITVSLEKGEAGQFKATAPAGAPFEIAVPVTIANGTLSGGATRVAISAGSVASDTATVTRTAGTSGAVTVDIHESSLPSLPSGHQGYALVKPDTGLPITVLEANVAPVFSEGASTTREVAENTAADQAIGDPVSATDANTADTLTYTLDATDTLTFSIDSSTGQLKTKGTLDYESETKSYSVTITVSDGTLTDTITVTITVTDVNDNDPVFSEDTTTREVEENTAADENIGDPISATDVDTVGTLTYTLDSGTDASAFNIDSSTGQLKTKNALDYEDPKKSYAVTVTVSDGVNTNDTIDVTITITDANDNAPTFDDGASTTREVAENTAAEQNIGEPIAATDVDTVGTLTYTLGGTDATTFSIDSATGQLKTKEALDYETQNSYSVTVTVSDGVNTDDTINVTINVTDVDDNAPAFTEGTDTTREIPENTEANQNIGTPVSATDANTGDTLTYTLDATGAITFSIDSGTGQLKTKEPLDYEMENSYSVTVTVSDGALTDTINVTINVADVNDNAPTFNEGDSTTREIAENTAADQAIGEPIAASDVDTVGTLAYTLDATGATTFSIDSETGQLKTKGTLDYETTQSYMFTVTVSDGVNTDDTIDVTINVIDITEVAPVFSEGTDTTREVPENTESNQNIGTPVAATDANTGDTLTYTLGGTDATTFSIDSETGQLKTKEALDRETKDAYMVTVTVSDGTLTDTITVTINITDVNDNAPMFTEGDSTTLEVEEVAPVDQAIGDPIAATDADTVGTLTYTIGGADSAPFSIVATSGQLRVRSALDYGIKNTYTFTVTVSDGVNTADTITVTIDLIPYPLRGRTQAVQNAIIAKVMKTHTDVTTAAQVTDAHLAAITSLSVTDDASLTSLLSDDFDGLTTLTTLWLSGNSLSSLPDGIFDGLTALKVLHLNNNSLMSLPSGVFDQNIALKELRLNQNVLGSLPDNIFDENTTLEQLYLDGNSLGSLPSGVFDENTALKTLWLSGNSLSSLPDNIFDKNTALITLYLNGNSLGSLPSGIFDENTALTTLWLSGNSLGSLPDNIFDQNTALEVLHLNNNSLMSLPSGVFDQNTALKELRLSENTSLSSLDADLFDGLTALEQLRLTNISLSSLDADLFDGLTALKILYLSRNALSALDADLFDGLTALEQLYLNGNALSALPDGIFDGLTALGTLHLQGNAVAPLPLTVSLEKVADGQFKVVAPAGAPFNIFVPVTVTNGSLSGGTTTVPVLRGSVESNTAAVTRTDGTTAAVTVDIDASSLPAIPSGHQGYALGKPDTGLPLTVIDADTVVTNYAPIFTEGLSTTREVAENTAADVNIGDPISATDADADDTLTYTLDVTGATTFSIESATGQLKTKAPLDYETTTSYTVTVTASDGEASDTITVTINITDIDDYPLAGRTQAVQDAIVAKVMRTHTEVTTAADVTEAHLAAITSLVLNNKSITSLQSGDFDGLTALADLNLSDNSISDVSPLEQLTVLTTLNLANNSISDISLLEQLTVLTTLNLANNSISDISLLEQLTVLTTLNLANNSISDVSPLEQLTVLTTLNLANNSISDVSPLEQLTTLATLYLSGNTISDYAPLRRLIAAIEADGRTLTLDITIPAVGTNNVPAFTDGDTTTRAIAENTVPGQNIGSPVAATDADTDDTLTYTLVGTDAAAFRIVRTSGQLQTSAALDYETKASYTVTISVSDGNGGSDTITVTINITDEMHPLEGRTQEIQDAIVAAVPNIDAAVDVTATHLAAITRLSVSNNDALTSLLPGDFAGLTELTNLQLGRNSLGALPDNIFDELTKLTELNLGFNELGALPAGVFDNNTALIRLQLNHNSLSALPAGIFNELTALTEISLNSNELNALPSGIFDELTALTQLHLTHNSLGALPDDVFDELTALTTLNLNDNSFSTLPADVFDELTALTHLSLSGNSLTPLPAGIFDELTALTTLGLGRNGLNSTSFPTGIFDNLTALTTLYLNGNALSALPANLFDPLTALTQLVLHGNSLRATSFPEDIFVTTTPLTLIRLENNSLSALPDGIFDGVTALTHLNLSGNTIEPLPLTVSLEKGAAAGEFKAVAPAGAPFAIDVPVTVTNGSISGGATTVTISAGSVESDTITITRTAGTTAAVTVDIGTLPAIPSGHQGYELVEPDTGLPLTVIDAVGNAPILVNTPLMPKVTAVLPNYPNPFNPETWIPYQLAKPADVAITIYDVRGRVVRRLALGHQVAGYYTDRSRAAHWDGRNVNGEPVASGIYFYTLTTQTFTATRRMLILK